MSVVIHNLDWSDLDLEGMPTQNAVTVAGEWEPWRQLSVARARGCWSDPKGLPTPKDCDLPLGPSGLHMTRRWAIVCFIPLFSWASGITRDPDRIATMILDEVEPDARGQAAIELHRRFSAAAKTLLDGHGAALESDQQRWIAILEGNG